MNAFLNFNYCESRMLSAGLCRPLTPALSPDGGEGENSGRALVKSKFKKTK